MIEHLSRRHVTAALLAIGLAACGASSGPGSSANDVTIDGKYWVQYNMSGALSGARAISEHGESRVACTTTTVGADGDPGKGYVMVLSADRNLGETRAAGVYFKMYGFVGVGDYVFKLVDDGKGGTTQTGLGLAYDDGDLESCTRAGDESCYRADTTCTVSVTNWDMSPAAADPLPGLPSGVGWGVGDGTIHCTSMTNATTTKTIVFDGSFHCRASDWSTAGE